MIFAPHSAQNFGRYMVKFSGKDRCALLMKAIRRKARAAMTIPPTPGKKGAVCYGERDF